jgi:hypothetical protein
MLLWPITMLLSLPVELGYCRARAAAAAARLWWLPVGGGGGLGTVDLVAVVEIAVVPMPPTSHDRAAQTPRMKTAASLIEGGRAIVRSAEGLADHYAGVTDRGAGPLWGAGGGSRSTAAAGRRLGDGGVGGRRLGGLGGVEAPQLKYLALRDRDRCRPLQR